MNTVRAIGKGGGFLLLLGIVGCGPTGEPVSVSGAQILSKSQRCEQLRTLIDTAQVDNFAARFSSANDKFSEALQYYNDPAFDVAADCPDERFPSQAFLLGSQGLSLSNQEQFLLASRRFDQAEANLASDAPIDERVLLCGFRLQDQLNKASVQGRGSIEAARGQLTQCQSLLARPEAQGVLRGSGSGSDIIGLDRESIRQIIGTATGDHAQSVLSMNVGNLPQAKLFIERALNEITRTPGIGAGYIPRFSVQNAVVDLEIAQNSETGRAGFATARGTASTAVERVAGVFPGSPLHARALMVRARAESGAGYVDAALSTYDEAFAVYRNEPTTVTYESIWSFFALASDLLLQSPGQRDAIVRRMFDAAQIIRSSTVAKTIAASSAALRSGASNPAVAAAARELREAEEAYNLLLIQQVLVQGDTLRIESGNSIEEQVEEARVRRQNARAALGLEPGGAVVEGAEEYATAIDASVTLETLQASLEANEALVQVLTGSPRGIVFVVTPTGVDFAFTEPFTGRIVNDEADRNKTPETLAIVLRERFNPAIADQLPYPVAAAHEAFQTILGPAWPLMADKSSLIFAISGPLSAVPLELFVTEPPSATQIDRIADGDYSDIAFLGIEKDISYVPAPRSLSDLRGSSRRAHGRRASDSLVFFTGYEGVAPGNEATAVSNILESNPLVRSRQSDECYETARSLIDLSPVDPDERNARLIMDEFGPGQDAIRSGMQFTQPDVIREAAGSRILHFNTHGILWETPDCFDEPALLVNPVPGQANSAQGDRLFKASEIQGLSLDADLVVLAACDTAGGDGLGGESLSGLARAFFLANASSVIASHWQVEEGATARFMETMYGAIRQNPSISYRDALSVARDASRRSQKDSHPYFWGAFVLIGDGSQSFGS